MTNRASDERVAHLVDPRHAESFDVMGPTIQFLTLPDEEDRAPCVMRGIIPPGVFVPLHSHPDPETFLAVSGELEGLAEADGSLRWIRIKPGDVFHVPGGAKHAFRNRSQEPAVAMVVSTAKHGRFFQEIGTRVVPGTEPPGPPSGEVVRHFLETGERYGYWNATPEENAQIGLSLPSVG